MNSKYNRSEIIELFKEAEAIIEGHFLLTSGRHSQTYIQCAKIQQYPQYMEKLISCLSRELQNKYDLVVGPAMGGIIMAYELARQNNLPAMFSERNEGRMEFRRGFGVEPGQRVLVAEDVVTTGGSVVEVIELLQSQGAQVVDVAALVDRSGGKADFSKYGAGFTALLEIDIETYLPEQCPLCVQGSTPVKPGSRKIGG